MLRSLQKTKVPLLRISALPRLKAITPVRASFALTVVFLLKVLVVELLSATFDPERPGPPTHLAAVDRLTACSVHTLKVPALDHEARYDTMEQSPRVSEILRQSLAIGFLSVGTDTFLRLPCLYRAHGSLRRSDRQ